jgi:hypothetical protein
MGELLSALHAAAVVKIPMEVLGAEEMTILNVPREQCQAFKLVYHLLVVQQLIGFVMLRMDLVI